MDELEEYDGAGYARVRVDASVPTLFDMPPGVDGNTITAKVIQAWWEPRPKIYLWNGYDWVRVRED